nr:sugar nucleotide-binding protein [Nesterenkonia sp. AN1]
MTVERTPIPGLLVVHLPLHRDTRGWFKEDWQREKMVAAGLPDVYFRQHNISYNATVGTTRGIHAEPWDKYVSVSRGGAFGAWVDLREGKTFGRVHTERLGPEIAVFVPRGVGNAFQALEPETAYTYLVTDHWSSAAQERYTFLNLNDETAAVPWPIPLDAAELSEKDHHHPRMSAVIPMPPAPILILGAGGQLGTALVETCRARNIPHRAFTREMWDLSRPESWPVSQVRDVRAVVNAAAYTRVDRAETSQGREKAWRVNATGVAALTALCRESDTPLIHISTDYVFDGALPAEQEYGPTHPVSPLSVYGQTKAAGESAVRTWTKHHIVRTSCVIGTGKNFVTTMRDLAESGANPVVVNDQCGRLTFVDDLAKGVLQLVTGPAEFGTYHFTNTGPALSRYEVARQVFELSGHDPDRVSPTSTELYCANRPGAAPRPPNGRLLQDGVAEVFGEVPPARRRLEEHLRHYY